MKKPFFSFSPSHEAWQGAAVGMFFATLFIIILSTIDLFNNNVSLGDATLYFLAGSFLTALFGVMVVFIGVLYANVSALSKWAIACFAVVFYYFFIPNQTPSSLLLIGIWIIVSCSLTCGSLWSLMINRKEKNKVPTLCCLLIGILGVALLGFWVLHENVDLSPKLNAEGKKKIVPIDLPNPALPGEYLVKRLSYGSRKPLKHLDSDNEISVLTRTVNGTPFIKGWRGLSGWLRTRYWGFDSTHLPLNGQIWYPEGSGPFPLILIIHGNHEMSIASDKGYSYLAELLASHGFITVSIDQNFLNGGWIDFTGSLIEMPARAWLILEHLNLWREWNNSKHSTFSNKVDVEKIALVGHSRGGEAIALAASFNELTYYPENGNIAFDYHFNLKALAAIASVDAQYFPGGQRTNLYNIDYFAMQGAHDGDVRSFEGSGQYNRIHFNDSEYHFKASLYVVGANHSQFNSLWGKSDTQLPSSLLFNFNEILPEKDQRTISKVYITAFLEAVLHDKNEYLPLFHHWLYGKNWLPETTYFSEFSDSNETYLMSDEKAIDLGKTLLSGTAKGENLKIWRQDKIILRENNPVSTGTFIGWKNSSLSKKIPSYTITLPSNEISLSSVLVLSIASSHDDKNTEHAPFQNTELIDFTLQLEDTHGEKASLPLSHYSYLQPALKLHLMKSDLLDPLEPSENNFQTFEFPIGDFIHENPQLNVKDLTSLSLIFDKTPESLVIIESISIRKVIASPPFPTP